MAEVKPSDVLVRAQELLGNRGQRWIRGSEHESRPRHILGIPMPFLGKEDTYCSIGAVRHAAGELGVDADTAYYNAERTLKRHMHGDIVWYNDVRSSSFRLIKQAFCEAIKDALAVEEREARHDAQ